MIVPTTVVKEVQPHLASVAKDEKIWFPTTVFAESRYQDQIRYGDSENHSPVDGWGDLEGSGYDVIKICLNQHKNWKGCKSDNMIIKIIAKMIT